MLLSDRDAYNQLPYILESLGFIVQQINGTEIRLASNNEILATLNTVAANALNADDFISG